MQTRSQHRMNTFALLRVCTLLGLALIAAGIVCAAFCLSQAYDVFTGEGALVGLCWALIAVLAALAALVIILYRVNQNKILKPTIEMERHFSRIAQGDLHTRCSLPTDDTEIGQLVRSANLMQATFSHYITSIESVLSALAHGNLSVKTDQDFTGDFVRIRQALEQITASFGDSFDEINNASDEMSSGAEQISIGATSLSEGSSEQAATIEELASAMSGVSQRVTETVNSAEKVRAAAVEMMDIIRRGNESLSRLSATIEETGSHSSAIDDIVKVIDGIAFQTNILALNAAVEAARAGDNGAAFGVVADEVRTLANQTAQNANTISDTIKRMLASLAEGVAVAKATEGALESIVSSADNVQKLITRITEAMESDAAAVEESLAGLEQLSAVVQENSATAEESAAASQEIAAQAMAVKELVGKFKR